MTVTLPSGRVTLSILLFLVFKMSLIQSKSIFDSVNAKNPVQQASKSISETVSGLKSQIVNPLKSVTSSINAGIATVKEGQAVITENLSAYKSAAIDGINDTLKNITGGLFNVKDIGRIITYQDGFKVNTDELLSIGSKGLGFNVRSLTDLKQQIGDGFINELDSMTGGLAKGMFTADGVKIALSDDWQFGITNSIVDFLGKDSDLFASVVNTAGINSILNVMLNKTIQNGMYQGYSAYKTMYVFESDYHDALISSIGIAIGKGDLKSIKTILDILKEEGTNKVAAKYPTLIEQMLSTFKFGEDTVPSEYDALTEMLLNVCVTIGGSDWYRYPTQHGMAINVTLVNSITSDAKLLLETTDILIPFLCASGIYTEQVATEVFMTDFPNALNPNL